MRKINQIQSKRAAKFDTPKMKKERERAIKAKEPAAQTTQKKLKAS